ncbi:MULTISPECIES: thioredoxin domain-containing protein [unclassified Sphingomonas]|uniref:DsbA family protein n=1 Tax=unclassified Sphingomonas TaxID=196159 RepID=UPI00226ACEDF|nr:MULTISPECIES: thioredoxin domain-containing protein [unclassified Sphingomonas]
MIRPLLALIGIVLLTAAAPVRDWSSVVTRTPAGTFLIGNPAARVKLVEYASYTCPHCAAFAKESEPVLKAQMIRSGSTSLEFRNLIRDRLDLAASLLARCTGVRDFAGTNAAIFAAQGQWLERGFDYQESNGARLGMYPVLAQLRAYADGAGLTALVQARGLSPKAIDACFADQAEVDRILAISSAVPAGVAGTPAFFVNGKAIPTAAWAGLEPALRAAGAK